MYINKTYEEFLKIEDPEEIREKILDIFRKDEKYRYILLGKEFFNKEMADSETIYHLCRLLAHSNKLRNKGDKEWLKIRKKI